MDINSLPTVPQHHVDAMNKIAREKYGVTDEVVQTPVADDVVQQESNPIAQASSYEDAEASSPQAETYEEAAVVQDNPVATPSVKKTPHESFRELKAAKERAEREREDLRKLYEYERLRAGQSAPQVEQPQPSEDTLEFDVHDDDLAEGKHLSRLAKEIKSLKEQQKLYHQQAHTLAAEARIKSEYPDFDRVVTQENLEMFKYSHPELTASINSNSDLYTKAVTAYQMIKAFGPKEEVNVSEKKRVEANMKKPRLSPAAHTAQYSDSPLTKATAFENGLTPQLMEQLNKEMAAARKFR